MTYLQSDVGHTALSCPRMNSETVPLCLLGHILWKGARGLLVFLSHTHRPLGHVFTWVAMSPSSLYSCLISCTGKETLSAPQTLSLIPCRSPIGRNTDINQEALEDFQNALRAGGFNPENIFIPEQRGRNQAAMLSRYGAWKAASHPGQLAASHPALSFRGGRDAG